MGGHHHKHGNDKTPSVAINSIEAAKAGRKTAVVGAAGNLIMAIGKLWVGYTSGASVLIADGIHSLSDLITDIISYFAISIGREEADETHPYGHGKFETIGTLVLSILLGVVAIGIVIDAIERVFTASQSLHTPQWAMAIASGSILINEALYQYTRIVGEKINSKLIIANAWHHRSDAISSIVAFAGIGFAWAGITWADTLTATIVAFMILKMSWEMGKDSFDELVEAGVDEPTNQKMFNVIKNIPGVKHAHFMRARKIAGHIFADVHVEVNPYISVSEGHEVAEQVLQQLKFKMPEITDVTVHIDPGLGEELHNICVKYPTRREVEAEVQKAINMHAKQATILNMNLHLLPKDVCAEITVNHNLEKAVVEKIQNYLTKPTGIVDRIEINVRL